MAGYRRKARGGDQNQLINQGVMPCCNGRCDLPAHGKTNQHEGFVNILICKQGAELRKEKRFVLSPPRPGRIAAPIKIIRQYPKATRHKALLCRGENIRRR